MALHIPRTTSLESLVFYLIASPLPNLHGDNRLKGGILYQADGTPVGHYGSIEALTFEQAKTLQADFQYGSPWQYKIAQLIQRPEGSYYLLLCYDATAVATDLAWFSVRIAGLILLVSGSVTVLMMAVVHRKLIAPILLLKSDVCQSGNSIGDSNAAQPFGSLQYQSQNELREVIHAFHQTYQQMVNAIAVRKQSEASLHQSSQQLKIALNDLQQTQAHLIHAEKMSSLGQLSAGFAHEVNNPINFIHANLAHVSTYGQDLLAVIDQFQQELPHPSVTLQEMLAEVDLAYIQADMSNLIQSMQAGTNRIRTLVTSFRNFTRLDEADHKSVDLHEGLESTLILLQERLAATDLRSAIALQRNYGNLPLITCYPSQLNQAFFYLLINAIEAIDLRCQIIASEEPTLSITTITSERSIHISIQDTGIGIEPEIQPKIFDPFFTTKDVGQGMGLGLTNSYYIVRNLHQGTLVFTTVPKQGTTFMICLPK